MKCRLRMHYKLYLVVISFIILSILSHILLLHSHTLFLADDMQFHLKRINEIIYDFNHLKFTPYSFNDFNGSAVMAYYPYLNLFPFVFLNHIIKSKILIVYIFFIITTFISLIVSFFSSRSISKNFWISYIFSVIYSLSPVLMAYDYQTMDLGMVTAVSLFPLVFFGCIHLLLDNHYIEFVIGLILIMYCHILTFSIAMLLVIILLLVNYKQWSKCMIINLIRSLILLLLTTSLVWVPIIYLSINNNIRLPVSIKLHGIPNILILKSFFGNMDVNGLGTFTILAIFISLIFWNKLNSMNKQFYIISVGIVVICSKLFPWDKLPTIISLNLSHFQFTFRFLVIPILLLSYVFSYLIINLHLKTYFHIVIFIILILAIGERLYSQKSFLDANNSDPIFSVANKRENKFWRMSNNKELIDYVKYRPEPDSVKDYLPLSSTKIMNRVSNAGVNKGIINYNTTVPIIHSKKMYNQFHFNNRYKTNSLILPIVIYNKENLKLFINSQPVNYIITKHHMIFINDVKKGNNKLKIKYLYNYDIVFIEIGLLIFGISYLIYLIYKENSFNVI